MVQALQDRAWDPYNGEFVDQHGWPFAMSGVMHAYGNHRPDLLIPRWRDELQRIGRMAGPEVQLNIVQMAVEEGFALGAHVAIQAANQELQERDQELADYQRELGRVSALVNARSVAVHAAEDRLEEAESALRQLVLATTLRAHAQQGSAAATAEVADQPASPSNRQGESP